MNLKIGSNMMMMKIMMIGVVLLSLLFMSSLMPDMAANAEYVENDRKSLKEFYAPVRKFICEGKATPSQLDRILDCRTTFRKSIDFPETAIEFQTKIKDCLTMILASNRLSFPIEERHKELVYSTCVPSFRQCIFRQPRNRIPKIPVSKQVFQKNLSTMMECHRRIAYESLMNRSSSSSSSPLS